jgi:hypothetical protein
MKAARLHRRAVCARIRRPALARPSALPKVDEFNVSIGFDTFSEKDSDSDGAEWQWLNILCCGSSFQVCCLLDETNKNPTSSATLEAYELSWGNWAGEPEVGVIVDRAKGFLGKFAEHMASSGCLFDSAGKASAWHIAKVERHGGICQAMLRRVVHAKQLAGNGDERATEGIDRRDAEGVRNQEKSERDGHGKEAEKERGIESSRSLNVLKFVDITNENLGFSCRRYLLQETDALKVAGVAFV